MIFRDAIVADLLRIEPQAAQIAGNPCAYLSDTMTYQDLHWLIARTAEEGDEILASYGLTQTLPRVAEAWAVFSERGLSNGREITEDVLFWLDRAIQKFDLRRVQATAYLSHEAAHRWLECLGFQWEGRLRSFGLDGQDCFVYGRIR